MHTSMDSVMQFQIPYMDFTFFLQCISIYSVEMNYNHYCVNLYNNACS